MNRSASALYVLPVLALSALLAATRPASAQSTAFTYQGSLSTGGAPANGNFDLQLGLYSTSTGGSPLATPVTNAAVPVTNGLFTTTVDFGAVFGDNPCWLQIGVRSNSVGGSFTVLLPRQLLTPSPTAIHSLASDTTSGPISVGQLPANVALLNGNASFTGAVSAGSFGGSGSGVTNIPTGAVVGLSQLITNLVRTLTTNGANITVTTNASGALVISVAGLGSAAFQPATAFDAGGAAQAATNGLGSAAFQPVSAFAQTANNGSDFANPSAALIALGGAPASPGSFGPGSMTNRYPLLLNLDAMQVTGVATGTPMAMLDFSGHGYHATNGNPSHLPVFNQFGLNNKPAYTFNGSDFAGTPAFVTSALNNNFTVFVVIGNCNFGDIFTTADAAFQSPGTNGWAFVDETDAYHALSMTGNLDFLSGVVTNRQAVVLATSVSSSNLVVTLNGVVMSCQNWGALSGPAYPSQIWPYNTPETVNLSGPGLTNAAWLGAYVQNGVLNCCGLTGDIAQVLFYQGGMSRDDLAVMNNWLMNRWQIGGNTVYFVGDSVTRGNTTTLDLNFPAQTMALLGGVINSANGMGRWAGVNAGADGWTIAPDSVSGQPGWVNYAAFGILPEIKRGDIVALEACVNDLDRYGNTNKFWTNYTWLCAQFRQAGAQVVAESCLPRTALNDAGTNAYESNRLGFNAMLRANYYQFADALADIGGDPTIGTFASTFNTRLYSDGCHLTNGGCTVAATIIADAINSLIVPGYIPSTPSGPPAGLLGTNGSIQWNSNGVIYTRISTNGVTTQDVSFVQTGNNGSDFASPRLTGSNLAIADLSSYTASQGRNNAQTDVSNAAPSYAHQFGQTYSGNGIPFFWYNPSGASGDWKHAFAFGGGIAQIGDGAPTFQTDPLLNGSSLAVNLNGNASAWGARGGDNGIISRNWATGMSGSQFDCSLIRTNSNGVPFVVDDAGWAFDYVSPDSGFGATNWAGWQCLRADDNAPGSLWGVSAYDSGDHAFFGAIWGNSLAGSGSEPFAGIFQETNGHYVPTDPAVPWVFRADVGTGAVWLTNAVAGGPSVSIGPPDAGGASPLEIVSGNLALETNSTPPVNTATVRAWVTVRNGSQVFKMPLYQ
jgi:hypothetical protein